MGNTTIYLPEHIKKAAKNAGINLSKASREGILNKLTAKGVSVSENIEPSWIVLAKCPAGHTFTTSSLFPTCRICGKRFRLIAKNKFSRIITLVKGTMTDIQRNKKRRIISF